jgi:hypothetical protein
VHRRIAPLVLVLALTAIACGSPAPKTSSPQEDGAAPLQGPAGAGSGTARDDDCVQMTRGEFAEIVVLDNLFAPECPVLVTDQILRLRSLGVRVHTFTISENQDDMAPFLLDLTMEGGTVLETDRPLSAFVDAGVYEFYCKFHTGMDGVMQVVKPVIP